MVSRRGITLSQKILTWHAALCMSWLLPELKSYVSIWMFSGRPFTPF